MIEFKDFDNDELMLLNIVIREQMESFERLFNDEHVTDDMDEFIKKQLSNNSVTEEEMKAELLNSIYELQEVELDAERFSILSNKQLNNLRHVLSTIEDDYQKDYPRAIANLWEKFFFLEKFRKIENLN